MDSLSMGGYESMVEILGIVATLFILAAFSLNDKKLIRLVDSMGAVLFVIYGILINSLSVWLLNICLIIINLYKIKNNK
jgi:hypothetical protein